MSTDYEMQARGQIEERARDEFLTNDPMVAEWLATQDVHDIAPLLTLAFRHRVEPDCKDAFRAASDRMKDDYIGWRIEQRDMQEDMQELAHKLEREDFEATRDSMMGL